MPLTLTFYMVLKLISLCKILGDDWDLQEETSCCLNPFNMSEHSESENLRISDLRRRLESSSQEIFHYKVAEAEKFSFASDNFLMSRFKLHLMHKQIPKIASPKLLRKSLKKT